MTSHIPLAVCMRLWWDGAAWAFFDCPDLHNLTPTQALDLLQERNLLDLRQLTDEQIAAYRPASDR